MPMMMLALIVCVKDYSELVILVKTRKDEKDEDEEEEVT